ncbi:MAG: carboxy terminal-processing peptidase [Saprospiraceae bacterium]|nr:carboxy terminal-processing peptidase [Saprospiraceae bacterium]
MPEQTLQKYPLMTFLKSKIMRYSASLIIVALFGFFMYKAAQPKIINPSKEGLVLESIISTIQAVHLNPKPIDDTFSKTVFDDFIKKLDPSKIFFIKKEFVELQKFEMLVDDQVNARNFDFFDKSFLLSESAIDRAKIIFEEEIEKPFDFDKNEIIETDRDKRMYAKDEKELRKFWNQELKYDILQTWVSKTTAQDKKENKEEIKSEEELKADAVKEVKKRFTNYFKRLKELRRSDKMEFYLNSITTYFDPHTDYFSPKDKEDFDINMGGQLEGIGARLQSDGEYTKVSSVVVGGPAWKTKKLEDNDIILKVAQKGEESVDIAGMRLDDVVQLVRGKKGTVVVLTIKKKDNSVVEIEIERDKVQLDDSKAKSVMINIPGTLKNIGYINLPKFYSSFELEGGNSCAYDVLMEIRKLKEEDVNGIILDLRNNSGGSLNDVVEMSGYFVEDGPIVQVKGREDSPFVHQDKNKSVEYDGPLVIMVNQFSASASEIIAAAMQDYGRAIVVGTPTFGKGTVQRFFDLDRAIRGYSELKPLGNVKMTVQKFYRINGGSTQLQGVIPDITLPDLYAHIDVGEKEYENAMTWTEIKPVKFSQNVVELTQKNALVAKSKSRVDKHPQFSLIKESALKIKEDKEKTSMPLEKVSYVNMRNQREQDNKKYDIVMKDEIAGLEISNLTSDLEKINLDEKNQALNQEFIKDLRKDIYLEEVLFIMKDMIQLEKSFAVQQKKIAEAK